MKPTIIKDNAKRILLPLALIAVSFAWTGCEKDYNYVAPVGTTPTPGGGGGGGTTVSFASDIQPILNANCATASCHGGTVSPDLSAASAYAELTGGGYINTGEPTSSDLYRRITLPSSDPAFMPEGGTPLTSAQTSKILTWITEGATNN